MELLIVQLPPPYCNFIPFASKFFSHAPYFPKIPFNIIHLGLPSGNILYGMHRPTTSGTRSGSYPVAGFGTSGVDLSSSMW
jgi:hypothetical protein